MEIAIKSFLAFLGGLLLMGAMLFLPAGTFEYWQAWAYLGIVFGMMALVLVYFLWKDPQFLERRFKAKEKEGRQRLVQGIGAPLYLIGFLLPGLDRRFGWTHVPMEFVLAADFLVLLGYAIIFIVFRENHYAGRTIEVVKGQKVIDTGPYGIVRHPMYAGAIVMFLATPLALGSYVAIVPFLIAIPLLYFRILNEEEVLKRELKGYIGYCRKVKYRLVPGIW